MLKVLALSFALAFGFAFKTAYGKTVTGTASYTAVAKARIGSVDLEGKGSKVTGTVDDAGVGTYVATLKDLKSTLALRDEHMREYLEVSKYPDAKLVVTSVSGETFKGDFTLHGVTKPVQGKVKVDGSHVKAWLTRKLSDYGLPVLKKAGVTVQDEIKVAVEVTVQ